MVVMCYDSGINVYDTRRLELSNAPLHMKQDTTSIEQYLPKPNKYINLPALGIPFPDAVLESGVLLLSVELDPPLNVVAHLLPSLPFRCPFGH